MTTRTAPVTIRGLPKGLWVILLLFSFVSGGSLLAQGKKDEGDPRLEARPVTLKTKDGMELRAFYFPSDKEKSATTVLLVHEWKGQASPYYKLVLALNKAGCAVIAPDYRGHGGSKEYLNVRGEKAELDPDKMSRKEVEAIVAMDLEKTKGFLKKENNDGYLNLNALVVVGIGEGCVLGNLWAMRDWSFPSLGSVKQGQDVKGLVMISPEKQLKGLAMEPALNDLNLLQLPILIVAGEGSTQAGEARRMASRIEARKKRVGRGDVSGLNVELLDSDLANAALVTQVKEAIPAIVSFVTTEIKGNDTKYPWVERK